MPKIGDDRSVGHAKQAGLLGQGTRVKCGAQADMRRRDMRATRDGHRTTPRSSLTVG